MAMNLLYSRGKSCSTGAHNETMKKVSLFSGFINRILIESQPPMSNLILMLSVLQANRKFIIFTVTTVIYKFHNLIGILESSEFEPKSGHFFQSNIMCLC